MLLCFSFFRFFLFFCFVHSFLTRHIPDRRWARCTWCLLRDIFKFILRYLLINAHAHTHAHTYGQDMHCFTSAFNSILFLFRICFLFINRSTSWENRFRIWEHENHTNFFDQLFVVGVGVSFLHKIYKTMADYRENKWRRRKKTFKIPFFVCASFVCI